MDCDLFVQLLMAVNWGKIAQKEIHSAVRDFTHALLMAAKTAILSKTTRLRPKDKPLVTNELKRNIRKRNRLFRQVKQINNDQENSAQFCHKPKQKAIFCTSYNTIKKISRAQVKSSQVSPNPTKNYCACKRTNHISYDWAQWG